MNIVILAAGQGKRMHSNLPKVLHPIAGKALVRHVIDTARLLEPEKLVVVYGIQQTLRGQNRLRNLVPVMP
jgi:bifunctional UDP-N-acetylglucosamine pyrophosphorylase/glucosamine-1-phosphate N-acetyltransferase